MFFWGGGLLGWRAPTCRLGWFWLQGWKRAGARFLSQQIFPGRAISLAASHPRVGLTGRGRRVRDPDACKQSGE